jgi:hypothetical protein
MNHSQLQISLGEEDQAAVDDDAYIKEIKDISSEVDSALEKL